MEASFHIRKCKQEHGNKATCRSPGPRGGAGDIIQGISKKCRERRECKADGAETPESRQVGMRISIPTGSGQRSNRVAEQLFRGSL